MVRKSRKSRNARKQIEKSRKVDSESGNARKQMLYELPVRKPFVFLHFLIQNQLFLIFILFFVFLDFLDFLTNFLIANFHWEVRWQQNGQKIKKIKKCKKTNRKIKKS